RINVICGPNNSGKTTVLECIASEELRWPGIASGPEVAEEIGRASVRGAGWGNDPSADRRYFAIVENAWKERPIWFADEFDQLWNRIWQVWSQNFGNWSESAPSRKQAFDRKFPAAVKSSLVPPKRRLETIKAVKSSDSIKTDGTG